MPLDSSNQIPFRRITNPLTVPVSPTASRFDVPDGFLPNGTNAFYVVNPNKFWVRLKGSVTPGSPYSPIVDGEGWLWGPGFHGVFTTQFPVWFSVISVTRQDLAAGTGTVELSYGMGA